MSLFDKTFGDGDYFECEKCGSLATIDKNGKLMRLVFNQQNLPVIYEEEDKEIYVDEKGNLKCDCEA